MPKTEPKQTHLKPPSKPASKAVTKSVSKSTAKFSAQSAAKSSTETVAREKLSVLTPVKFEFPSNTKVHPALQDMFPYCFYKSALRFKLRIEEELAPLGLIGPQMSILMILNKCDPLNQHQLGDELGIDKASMVKLIDGLEQGQFVERIISKNDRRVKFVRITSAGKKLIARAERIVDKIERQMLAPLDAVEVKTMREALTKLVRARS